MRYRPIVCEDEGEGEDGGQGEGEGEGEGWLGLSYLYLYVFALSPAPTELIPVQGRRHYYICRCQQFHIGSRFTGQTHHRYTLGVGASG